MKNLFFTIIFSVLVLLPASVFAACETGSDSSISQYGITWTFDREYQCGQFVNGDYWVLGPVEIVGISPRSYSSGSTINGSLLNPLPSEQGFDEDMPYLSYEPSLNVAADIDAGNPLMLEANSSLVSSVSANPTCGIIHISDIAVLSVLGQAPASGSFRPPYAGTSKPIHNISEIDYSALQSLPSVSDAPSLAWLEESFERVWYDNQLGWSGRMLHPCNNMPDYGADMAGRISQALLSLHLDYTNTEKEKLLISMLQYAIDLSEIVANGGQWPPNGGHALGRKSVLALGAMVLDDTRMKSQLNAGDYFVFGEDMHTWYISEADYYPNRTVCGYRNIVYGTTDCIEFLADRQYNSADHPVGMAEWGRNHGSSDSVHLDNSRLDASYRDYYGRQLGGLLSSLMLGAEAYWNWGPAFDYIERVKPYMVPPCTLGGACYYNSSEWELNMYDAYWDTYRSGESYNPPVEGPESDCVVSDYSYNNINIGTQNNNFKISFSVTPNGSGIDGFNGLNDTAGSHWDDYAAIVRFFTNGRVDAINGDSYSSDLVYSYVPGRTYIVEMVVDMQNKIYDVFVSYNNEKVQIANDYSFRTSRRDISSISYLGVISSIGSHELCDVSVESSAGLSRADVDVSGAVNSTDALLTLRRSLNLSMTGTAWVVGVEIGDVDCSGLVNSTDALLILRRSLGFNMSGTGWCS